MFKSNKHGITLIEVLISITVLALGVLGLLRAFPRGLATDKYLESATIAEELAQAKMEELAALPYDGLAAGNLENQVHAVNNPGSPLYGFLRSTTVALLDQNLNPSESDIGLKKITITIYWPAALGGGQKNISLATLISKR